MVRETLKAREANNIVRRDMLDLLVQAQKGTLKSENDNEQKNNSTNSGKTGKNNSMFGETTASTNVKKIIFLL